VCEIDVSHDVRRIRRESEKEQRESGRECEIVRAMMRGKERSRIYTKKANTREREHDTRARERETDRMTERGIAR